MEHSSVSNNTIHKILIIESRISHKRKRDVIMYDAFDNLLKHWTWHTSHSLDLQRFDMVLEEVIHLPDFDPDQLGIYMKENGVRLTMDTDKQVDRSIQYLVERAWKMKKRHMH